MFAANTEDLVSRAISEELEVARTHGKKFSTNHEAYAVLKEEIEETRSELEMAENYLIFFWNLVKKDAYPKELRDKIEVIYESAKNAAKEALQVCAVCRKALDE